jgi:hypothetical protein
MGTLIGLLKAAINAALLNKTVRGALLMALTSLMNWVMQPSTSSRIIAFVSSLMKPTSGSRPGLFQTLIKGAFGLVLLRLTASGQILKLVAFSGLGALLLDLLKASVGSEDANQKKGQKDRVIDIDEYTVIEEKQ